MAELLTDTKLASDRAGAAGADRVDEQARARLHARYQRLLAHGWQPTCPNRPPPGQRPPLARCQAAGRRPGVPDLAQLCLDARKQGMNPRVVLRQLF
jgi:hypothetical protein